MESVVNKLHSRSLSAQKCSIDEAALKVLAAIIACLQHRKASQR